MKALNPYSIALGTALLAFWEIAARLWGGNFFPPLSTTMVALWNNAGTIALEVVFTLLRAVAALAIDIALMVPLGIVVGRTPAVARFVEPVINLLRPLPPPAIAPLAILFAGVGSGAKIGVIAYAAAFPILLNTIDGVRAANPTLVQVARSLRLTRLETMWSVNLPETLPVIFTGIRLAVTVALLVSVVSEMLLTTNGIGVFILRAQERFEIANELAGIVVVACLGVAINTLFMRLDRHFSHWHYATRGH